MKKNISFRLHEEFEISRMRTNSLGHEYPINTQVVRAMDFEHALRVYLEWNGGSITLVDNKEFIRASRIRKLPHRHEAYERAFTYFYFS
jgi:hypothetical protein